MQRKDTPNWVKDLHLPLDDRRQYPPEVNIEILEALQKLSLGQLDQLADISGVRDYLGVLLPRDEWSREQYIEILSDISEMTEGQIQKIRSYLNIAP